MTPPPVDIRPFTPRDALNVLECLDLSDQTEVALMRGSEDASALAVLADWMMMNRQGARSFVAFHGGVCVNVPFAVLAIVPGDLPGCGRAALLAKDHRFFKRELVAMVRIIRAQLPDLAYNMGLHRIEARSWYNHPTAASLLQACGFTLDATMPGFGISGEITIQQYAWHAEYIIPTTISNPTPPTNHPQET